MVLERVVFAQKLMHAVPCWAVKRLIDGEEPMNSRTNISLLGAAWLALGLTYSAAHADSLTLTSTDIEHGSFMS